MENTKLNNKILDCFKNLNSDNSDIMMSEIMDSYFKMGVGNTYAHILSAIHGRRFTTIEIVEFIHKRMQDDEYLKDYVYETMKNVDIK